MFEACIKHPCRSVWPKTESSTCLFDNPEQRRIKHLCRSVWPKMESSTHLFDNPEQRLSLLWRDFSTVFDLDVQWCMFGILLVTVTNSVCLNTIPYWWPFQFTYPFTLICSFIPVRSYNLFSSGITDEVYNLVFSPMTAPITSDPSTSKEALVVPILGTSHIDYANFPG